MIGTGPNEAWTRRKMAARKYAPNRLRLLLVAESPPDDLTRSFYFEEPNSADPVFDAVCEVLFEERPAGAKVPFLKELKRRGVFLVELKPDAPRGDEKLAPYVPPLLINLDTLSPENIILISDEVYEAAFRAIEKAGLPVVDVKVPSPGAGDEASFRNKFRQALVRGGFEKLIKPLSAKARGGS
jgi:hypothetical protein